MESIYYVMTFLCHRNCPHCYEDRFHPYHGDELSEVVRESRANFSRIIANFPDSMRFQTADGTSKRGRVIVAGGEILLEAVRESVLYPGLEQLYAKYEGDVQLVVQTTGDLVTDRIVGELLERHVSMISVSGIDAFHAGLEKLSAREALMNKLRAMFERHGVAEVPESPGDGGPYFHFFGANPDTWIGKIWPRGRAWANNLSTATIEDNFCNGWSGGLRFLEYGQAGAEVSIEPNGNVYPCCMKTGLAIGNLLDDKLETILRRLRGNPVYEAINQGAPQRMGLAMGWSEADFLAKSRTVKPDGSAYANLCIGCDAFHREKLALGAAGLVRIGA
jgi:hypothetical protein